jgi:hypothetical protein
VLLSAEQQEESLLDAASLFSALVSWRKVRGLSHRCISLSRHHDDNIENRATLTNFASSRRGLVLCFRQQYRPFAKIAHPNGGTYHFFSRSQQWW